MIVILDGPVSGNWAAAAASAVRRFFPEYPVSRMRDWLGLAWLAGRAE